MKYLVLILLYSCTQPECQECKRLKNELKKANSAAIKLNRLLDSSNIIIISDGYKLTKAGGE